MSCNTTGFGTQGLFTYHNHETLLEDYVPNTLSHLLSLDSFTSSDSGINASSQQYFLLQVGYKTCFAPFNDSTTYPPDSYIPQIEAKVKPFFQELFSVMNSSNVIVSLPGRSFSDHNNRVADVCTWKLNRMITHQAHLHGWMVLEREEIEHRLVLKSDYVEEPLRSTVSMMAFPAPQMISASLITMLHCLDQQQTFQLE